MLQHRHPNRSRLLGLIVFILLAGVVVNQSPGEDDSTDLSVVKTWRDLQSQPAISLGDGVTVRLGIEAKSCPRWSGVLVYCYCEGMAGGTLAWEDDNALGPLRMTCRLKHRNERAISRLSAVTEVPRQAKLLFVRSVAADEVGDYQVKVSLPGGKVIGSVTVKATDEPFHAWMPFGEDTRLQELREQGEDDAPVAFVANRGDGIATPHWEGMEPIVFEGSTDGKRIKRSADERLPKLFPEQPHPGLKLKRKGMVFSVSCDEHVITNRAEEHFLTRWWVNGKPFVPKPIRELQVEDRSGLISFHHKLDLDLSFDPVKIGAKPGDTVQVQLLHCPSGWSWMGPDVAELLSSPGQIEGSRISSRVSFVVPTP